MSNPAVPPVPAIPEERVAAILARAAELDRERKETISVDAIRAAAVDAGISVTAVDTALAEYAAGQPLGAPDEEAAPEPRFARVRRLLGKGWAALRTPVKLAAAFFVVGLTGAAGEEMAAIAGIAWLLTTAGLVLRHRRTRSLTPFVLSLVYMTFGLVLGFAAAEVDEDAIVAVVPVAVALLVAGSVAIKVRLRRAGSRAELEAPAA